jgi:DNA modification methylase
MDLGDARAHGLRVPDDVWDIPRVTGNSKERRSYHPTQHPEALMERIILFSTRRKDTAIDLFGGTGTTLRVGLRLGRDVTSIELSEQYCLKVAEENNVPIVKIKDILGF